MKKQLFLFLLPLVLFSCTKEQDFNFYRYEIYGSTDDYEVTFKDKDQNVNELKDVGDCTLYEFSSSEKVNVYFSAQSVVDGIVVICLYKNGERIACEYTDGAENRIVIDGIY